MLRLKEKIPHTINHFDVKLHVNLNELKMSQVNRALTRTKEKTTASGNTVQRHAQTQNQRRQCGPTYCPAKRNKAEHTADSSRQWPKRSSPMDNNRISPCFASAARFITGPIFLPPPLLIVPGGIPFSAHRVIKKTI